MHGQPAVSVTTNLKRLKTGLFNLSVKVLSDPGQAVTGG